MAQLTRDEILAAVAKGTSLRGADLRYADLRDADLRGAAGVICAGTDARSYRFVGVMHADGPRIAAGCRWFTLTKARTHWTSNPDALARVELIAGWVARQAEAA